MRTLLFLTCLLWAIQPLQSQTGWLMQNGNPGRTSYVPEDRIMPPLQIIARFQAPDAGALTATTDQVFIGELQHTPNQGHAYNLHTGAWEWSAGVDGSVSGMNFALTVFDTIVYLGGQQGSGLSAVSRATGRRIWFKPVGTLYDRYVVHDGISLYVKADSLYRLNPHTGETVWAVAQRSQGTPAIDGERLYTFHQDTLWAFVKATGTTAWKVACRGYSLAADGARVYGELRDSVAAFDPVNGTIIWKHASQNLGQQTSSLAVSDESLFYVRWENAAKQAELHALDKVTGTQRWQHHFSASGAFTPTIAGRMVYVNTYSDRTLWGLDAASGQVLFQDTSSKYYVQPIVVDRFLIVGSRSAEITVFAAAQDAVHSPGGAAQQRLSLGVPYPNPAAVVTTLECTVPAASNVAVQLRDMLGRLVNVISDGWKNAGSHTLDVRLESLAPGIYVVIASDGRQTASRRVLVP